MISRIHLLILIALLGMQCAFSAAVYPRLPAIAPIHWDVHGRADGFGSPATLVAMIPIASGVLLAVALGVPRVGILGENLRRSRVAYGRILIAIFASLAATHAIVLLKAAGVRVRIEVILPCTLGVMIAIIGNWLGKVRRNRVVGIRTPWTLADDTVWERTNRAGGRLMVAYGLLVAAVPWLGRPWLTFGTIIGGCIALVVWSFVYSKQLSRRVPLAAER